MPDLDSQGETAQPLFGLLANSVDDGEYELQVAPLDITGRTCALMIEAHRLESWRNARGCEFCAHAVKLGRSVYCDHRPVTAGELAELGSDLASR